MKHLIHYILAFYLLCIFAINAFAVFPESSPYLLCFTNPNNVVKNAKYIELLIPKDAIPDEYLLPYDSTGSDIETYDKNGFVSYTHRYKNAVSHSELSNIGGNGFYENSFGSNEFFQSVHTICFAYTDQDGKVLAVTNAVNILVFRIFNQTFTVNIDGTNASLDLSDLPYMVMFISVLSLIIILPIALIIYFAKKRKTN